MAAITIPTAKQSPARRRTIFARIHEALVSMAAAHDDGSLERALRDVALRWHARSRQL